MRKTPTTQDENFVRLFGLNQGRVFAFIVSILPRWGDAEEVLQRTSIVLWKKFDQFDASGDFVRWACGIAYRETLKYLKQHSRQHQVFDELVLQKDCSRSHRSQRPLGTSSTRDGRLPRTSCRRTT